MPAKRLVSLCTCALKEPKIYTYNLPIYRLTGDHITTARAIAQDVEIITSDAPASAVMTAMEFDKLTDAEIDALPELPLVIARCAPETKGASLRSSLYPTPF